MRFMTGGETIWTLSARALREADAYWNVELDELPLIGLSEAFARALRTRGAFLDRTSRELFAESLVDLKRLFNECRFEAAFALMLLVDFSERRPDEVERLQTDPTFPKDFPVGVDVMALLAPYTLSLPPPSSIATRLHANTVGDTHLSRWVAGQLLDSAILRAMSCLDRIATMLHIAARRPIATKADGSYRLPAFEREYLKRLTVAYSGRSGWDDLRHLLQDPLYKLLKRIRDEQVHYRRWPSALHGGRLVGYFSSDADGLEQGVAGEDIIQAALTAQEHLAAVTASLNHLVKPATANATLVLSLQWQD